MIFPIATPFFVYWRFIGRLTIKSLLLAARLLISVAHWRTRHNIFPSYFLGVSCHSFQMFMGSRESSLLSSDLEQTLI